MLTVEQKVAESNRIEGIDRPATQAEIAEFNRFMALKTVDITELKQFVSVYQPGARLRDRHGLDVRVGDHIPPRGGPHILQLTCDLLDKVRGYHDPWKIHVEYETIHPFTDGNGRSGRMLWYWTMRNKRVSDLGFLHAFYYQTLSSVRL